MAVADKGQVKAFRQVGFLVQFCLGRFVTQRAVSWLLWAVEKLGDAPSAVWWGFHPAVRWSMGLHFGRAYGQ